MVSSIMALIPSPTAAGYGATKTGVEAFGRTLRIELADKDVRVGLAYFGLIDTGMVRDVVSSTGFGAALAKLPGLFGRPAPVAQAGSVMVAGIAHRKSRVFAPRYVRLLPSLRTVLGVDDRLVARNRNLANIIRQADALPVLHAEGAGHEYR